MNKFYTTIIIVFLTSSLFANASITHPKSSELITIVKEQLSLAKRVSTDYIAFQSDHRSSKKKKKMKISINQFNRNHLKLLKSKSHTRLTKQKLTQVSELWYVAHNLSEIKGLNQVIISSMQKITGKMKELDKFYNKNK